MHDWRLDEQELKPETPLFAKPKFQSSVSDFIESACAAIFCDSHNHHMLTSRAHSCSAHMTNTSYLRLHWRRKRESRISCIRGLAVHRPVLEVIVGEFSCFCNLPCQKSDRWPVLQNVGGKVEQQMVYVNFRCAELESLMLYYIVTYQATSGKFVCFLSFFCWCSSYFSSS
jgi:hypothetical protein